MRISQIAPRPIAAGSSGFHGRAWRWCSVSSPKLVEDIVARNATDVASLMGRLFTATYAGRAALCKEWARRRCLKG
jgi:hypothetical protein